MTELSRIEHLFLAAGEKTEFTDAWLRNECGGDSDLYEQVCSLLQVAKIPTDGILSQQIPSSLQRQIWNSNPAPSLHSGEMIDNYRIERPLGSGGMGNVFLARELQPVQRDVAIKLSIAAGKQTDIHRRFAVERQVLASLAHPGVPRIYNAGSDSFGRSYLVLEYIDGMPIAEFCRTQQIGLEDQLGLFEELCQIVSYAHSNGVIHRDIKSTNVLASVIDGHLSASLIDFGIARLIGHRPDSVNGDTQDGHVLGTPGCMSPEQFLPGSGSVDQRSDIYSLGLLLYKMLTDASPFDGKTLDPAARLNSLHHPTRVSSHGTVGSELQTRKLDMITSRCLKVSPGQRYPNVDELLEEVRGVHTTQIPIIATVQRPVPRRRSSITKAILTAICAITMLLLPGGLVERPDASSVTQTQPVYTTLDSPQLVSVNPETFEQIQTILSGQGLDQIGDAAIIVQSTSSQSIESGPTVTVANRPVVVVTPQLADSTELMSQVRLGKHSG